MKTVVLLVTLNVVVVLAFSVAFGQTVYYGNMPNRSGEIVTYTDRNGDIAGNSFRMGDITTFTDRNGDIAGNAIITDLNTLPPIDRSGNE